MLAVFQRLLDVIAPRVTEPEVPMGWENIRCSCGNELRPGARRGDVCLECTAV